MISSTHNPRVQLVRSLLGRSKERRESGAFIAEGVRLVEEAQASGWPFRFVLTSDSLNERGQKLAEQLKSHSIEVETVQASLMESISATETSQGILAVLDLASPEIPKQLSFALILDAIRDPGNLGTLLRTAAAAGVEAVFLPPDSADPFSPKVVRAGMGAHFHLPILTMQWDAIHSQTSALSIYLAEMEASLPCWQADFRSPLALIIGGEAEGASEPARRMADRQVFIPMPGGSESLNAAAAGAILMFEVVRQREDEQHLEGKPLPNNK